MEQPLDTPTPKNSTSAGHVRSEAAHSHTTIDPPEIDPPEMKASHLMTGISNPQNGPGVQHANGHSGEIRRHEAPYSPHDPEPKRHKPEAQIQQSLDTRVPHQMALPVQVPYNAYPNLGQGYASMAMFPPPHLPPVYSRPFSQIPGQTPYPHPPQVPFPGQTSQQGTILGYKPMEITSPNLATSEQAEPISKKQLERLEKQKQREAERAAKEVQKAEQLRIKKEEREKKELEKKLKREALEAEKEQKREQDRLRKEEKRKKQEEEKKRKEDDRLEREEEKRREEERKKKDERNQMKISNFFTVKKTASVPPSSETEDIQRVKSVPFYESDFLPFFQKRNVTMPVAQLLPHDLEEKRKDFDKAMSAGSTASTLSDMFPRAPPREAATFTKTEDLVEALNSSQTSPTQVYQLVQNLPRIKYLQFYENAKPPYVGTWCSEKHLSMNIPVETPLNKTITGFDYDYDSDLDWQENDEGEGEDLGEGEDGDEEDEDAEDDEMDDFVDNNEAVKNRAHIGPLQSICLWNNGNSPILEELRYERLDFDIDFPIDPFKNYWSASSPAVPAVAKEKKITSVSSLGTPVKAVSDLANPNILTPSKPVIKDAKVLESLREFIKSNSDFTIGTLSELAKREFKAYTKSILKHTIQEVASYNKKSNTWEIKPVLS